MLSKNKLAKLANGSGHVKPESLTSNPAVVYVSFFSCGSEFGCEFGFKMQKDQLTTRRFITLVMRQPVCILMVYLQHSSLREILK